MNPQFGPVRQVGYVVKDIEKAIEHWLRLGVGPWYYNKEIVSIEFRYQGKPSRFPKLAIALANTGDTQIELIQQSNDAPSLYLDTLARNGECAQHVAFWTADRFDEWSEHFLDHGYVEGHAGRMGNASRGRYAYFVHPDFPSAMFELSESTGGKSEYFEQIRKAAIDWDGSEPVRIVGGTSK